MKSGLFSKLIFSSLAITLFGMLILYSFFLGGNDMVKLPHIFDLELNQKVYTKGIDNLLVSQKVNFESLESFSGSVLFHEKKDIYTDIYSLKPDYSVNGRVITIGDGAYIIDCKDLFKKCLIKAKGYYIILESGGTLYVDNASKLSNIASFNSVAQVNFLNEGSGEENVEVYLYPHMYLGFRLSRFIKQPQGVDSLRVDQIGTLGYFSSSFEQIIAKRAAPYLKKGEKSDFFIETLSLLEKQAGEYEEVVMRLKSSRLSQFPGSSYIERYFSLFYNERKKSIYQKNRLFGQLIEMTNSSRDEVKLIKSILQNLSQIKESSEPDYNHMIELMQKMYIAGFMYFGDRDNILKKNWHELMKGLSGHQIEYESLFQKDFNRLNYKDYGTLYMNMLSHYSQADSDSDVTIQFEYYLFFIKNLILAGFNYEDLDKESIEALIQIYENYSEFLLKRSSLLEEEENTIKYVISNKDILEAVDKMIKSNFLGERSKEGLLLRGNQSNEFIQNLLQAIKNNLELYNKVKTALKNKGSVAQLSIELYTVLQEDFTEYSLALTSYSDYEKQYSKKNKNLLGAQVFQGDDDDDSLSIEKFHMYISQFNSISKMGIKVTVLEGIAYRVDNIRIDGNEFSFTLYPYSDNRITDIILKNNHFGKNSKEGVFYRELSQKTFQLDSQEEHYKKFFDQAKGAERDLFDFRNILSHLVSIPETEIIEDYTDPGSGTIEEDPFIAGFKSSQLLGKKGEFTRLKGFLDIAYNNITVVSTSRGVEVDFTDAEFRVKVSTGSASIWVYGVLDSEYAFNKHHFTNMRLQLYTEVSDGNRKYLFSKKYIRADGDMGIATFEKDFSTMVEKIYLSHGEYQKASKSSSNVSVDYSVEKNEVRIFNN